LETGVGFKEGKHHAIPIQRVSKLLRAVLHSRAKTFSKESLVYGNCETM
jgi:hypothetical protein